MAEVFIGTIQAFGFNYPPRGWAQCNGQLLGISQYSALFALLGTTFGGDGRTTFAVPDLRGRTMVHVGTGPGRSPINMGQAGGSETVTLLLNNLPAHTHTATLFGENGAATSADPRGNLLCAPTPTGTNIYTAPAPPMNRAMASEAISVASTGGSQPFNKRDPYLGVNICIALEGLFPSRN